MNSPPPQFLDIGGGGVVQPQHVIEIQEADMATNAQPPDFSILHPVTDEQGNVIEIVAGEVIGDSEYAFEDVTNATGGGVIVEYEAQDMGQVYAFPEGDQTRLQEANMDVQMLEHDPHLESETTTCASVLHENVEQEEQAETGKAAIEEETLPEDICRVSLEVMDHVFLEDMKNIDIHVVYSCKKCGYGDKNVADTINHTRSCSHVSNMQELNMKLSKVFNLFKTFSHRSVPLSKCIAPALNQNVNAIVEKPKTVKPVEKKKIPKTVIKPEPVEIDFEKGLSEAHIEDLIAKCNKAWKGVVSNPEGLENFKVEPRKWFCCECASTIIFSETEHDYHNQCHAKASCAKKFSCLLCKSSEEGRRKVLECDDWNTMKTHLTTIHQVDMKLECPICQGVFPSHQKYHKHVRSHKHQCRFEGCSFTSATKPTIFTHERCHSLEDTATFKCFKCDWVSEPFPKKWNLMHIHLTRNHPGTIEPLYSCKLCGREFAEIRRYNNHVTSCKNLPVPLRPTCLICGKLVNDTELREHILKHTASKHWYAKIKEVLTESPAQVADQEEKVVVSFNDRESARQDSSSAALSVVTNPVLLSSGEPRPVDQPPVKKQKRVLVSSGLLTEKCKLCYKKFATAKRLEKHVKRSHPDNGESPTVCDTCGSSFRNKEQWRNHNRQVHLGIKRKAGKTQKVQSRLFMCETCTYATPSLPRLRNHYSSVHVGVFPYHCKECQYKSNEASDMRRHMLKHQGKKPYACDNCDYKTTQRWILVNHAQRVHGVKLPKRTHDTMGCEFSLKRNVSRTATVAVPNLGEGTESEQVQYVLDQQSAQALTGEQANEIEATDLGEEVVLQIDDSEMTGETARLLASLSSTHPGLVAVQDVADTSSYIAPGGHQVVMLQMKQEDKEGGEGEDGTE